MEKMGDKRFLRRRYVDPMTGKDEWRVVHINGLGQLTDSLIQKPPGQQDDKNKDQLAGNTGGNLPAGILGFGSQPGAPATPGASNTPGTPGGPAEVNAAVLRRPSDRALTPRPGPQFPRGDANDPNAITDLGNANLSQAFSQPPVPGQPAFPPATGEGGAVQPAPGQPNFSQPSFNPTFPQAGFPQQNSFTPTTQFPPISLQAMQATSPATLPGGLPGGEAGRLPGGLPGASQPTGPAQFRIDQNGQFVPITPPPGVPTPGSPVPGIPSPFSGQLPGQVPNSGFPAQQFPAQQFPTQQFPAQQFPASQFPSPQFPNPSLPGQAASNQSTNNQSSFGNQPGAAPGGFPAPGQPGAPNAAINIINQLLTTPRQAPPGIAGAAAAGNLTAGGLGIAGVASTSKEPSIKRYRERGKYNEWEFVFDLQSTLPQQPNANQNNPSGQQNNPANSGSSGFGNTPAGPAPFGASPGGSGPGGFSPIGPAPFGASPGTAPGR
jgi:hypothetical protein